MNDPNDPHMSTGEEAIGHRLYVSFTNGKDAYVRIREFSIHLGDTEIYLDEAKSKALVEFIQKKFNLNK